MDAQEVVRKLVEACRFIEPNMKTVTPKQADNFFNEVDNAESWLKNGGWHKWQKDIESPEPDDSGECLSIIGGKVKIVYYNKDKNRWKGYKDALLMLWQPFPPLPEAEKVVHNSEKDT
jgi:hypothetical protein